MKYSQTILFADASDFIATIPEPEKAKVLAAIKIMETDMEVVRIKTLRGPIKELIVKKYRLLFFIKGSIVYFTNGFLKKTQKAPKGEIDYAEKIFSMI